MFAFVCVCDILNAVLHFAKKHVLHFVRHFAFCQVKSNHLYLYSAFNNTDCVKATFNIKIGK